MRLGALELTWIVPLAAALTLAGSRGARAQEPTTTTTAPAAKQSPTKNPFAGNADAVAEGKRLYFKWNCYGCHGAQGGGGMGPSLIDAEWRYGGDDASVFETIKNGRPKGMPVWGDKLSDDEIWKVIAYVRSLYKGPAEKIVW